VGERKDEEGELIQKPPPLPHPGRPRALRPAWVSDGGSREGQEADCGGEGAPRPAPRPGFLFSRQTVPTGQPDLGPGVFLRAAEAPAWCRSGAWGLRLLWVLICGSGGGARTRWERGGGPGG
jgi:hypothetical protein